MDIRGILLANSEQNVVEKQALGAPLATLDVVGKSTLQRMAERLQQYGISSVSAVVEAAPSSGVRNFGLPSDVSCVSAAPRPVSGGQLSRCSMTWPRAARNW